MTPPPVIRRVADGDDAEWLRMRLALWPDYPVEQLRHEMRLYRSGPPKATFVAEVGSGRLCGFLEFNLREFADGCESTPVAYVEGWYVDPEFRRSGLGRALIGMAERHARSAGCRHLASDCRRENTVSGAAHQALGFEEVRSLIHFKKPL